MRLANRAVLFHLKTRLQRLFVLLRVVVNALALGTLELDQIILGHSGKNKGLGIETRRERRVAYGVSWSHLSGSNRRPAVYKTAALPAELRWPGGWSRI